MHALVCPDDGRGLTFIDAAPRPQGGNAMPAHYHCELCNIDWTVSYTRATWNREFNRAAPFAQLVLDIDAITYGPRTSSWSSRSKTAA